MATSPTQVRIDSDIKKRVTKLFGSLGLDMSTAVNLFLYQCVLCGGLPFSVSYPDYNKETIEAMEEAERISKDPDVKGYKNMEDLLEALEK